MSEQTVAGAPVYRIPDDLLEYDDPVIQSAETWHLPRSLWRDVRNRVTGKKIRVAVLDTGIAAHSSLPTPSVARSYISGESVDDGNSHGTHCAGTVLSRDEDIGVAPDADLMVYKVLSNRGSGGSDGIGRAVRQAVEDGADVISMSLGGGSAHQMTIDNIEFAMNNGVIVAIAAGNSGFSGSGNTIGWPARSGKGICVVATRQDGKTAGFSSGGIQATIAAPGERILSTGVNNDWTFKSGTSMACPFTAGVGALVQELVRGEGLPRIRGVQAMQKLFADAADDRGAPGHDPTFGHGQLNVLKVIELLTQKDLRWLRN
jgi:subtilisin